MDTHMYFKNIFLMNTIFKHLITFIEKRLEEDTRASTLFVTFFLFKET